MSLTLLDALTGSEHEQIQFLRDPELGLFAVLAIHDSSPGPAFGGIRRCSYATLGEALHDVLRLSRAMSDKCALASIPGGGAKGVILDSPELDVPAAYRLLGRYVESLGGRWYTGPDVGTGERELEYLAEVTQFVTVPGERGPGDLGHATARGVLAALEAVAAWLQSTSREDAELGAHSYAVQGLGGVGWHVASALRAAGAEVIASELDAELLDRAVDELGVRACSSETVLESDCEVFVPCALGGILHDLSIERLRFRAICGSANNILASDEHGDALAARGILVAPDFVANSGALIAGARFHLFGKEASADSDSAIAHVGDELYELFRRAHADGVPPTRYALRIAAERRAQARRNDPGPFFPNEIGGGRA